MSVADAGAGCGAGTSGTFYIMASAYADMITKALDINTVAEVTAGSVENVTLMGDGKIELGVVQLDVTLDALAGTGKFKSPVPLTVLAPMYPNVIQIVTLADSEIKCFADLKAGDPGDVCVNVVAALRRLSYWHI